MTVAETRREGRRTLAEWQLEVIVGEEVRRLHFGSAVASRTRADALTAVAGPEDEVAPKTAAGLTREWVDRNGRAPGLRDLLLERPEALELPPDRGEAYLAVETSSMRAQRLVPRGLDRDGIVSERYWRIGRVGGHDHVED